MIQVNKKKKKVVIQVNKKNAIIFSYLAIGGVIKLTRKGNFNRKKLFLVVNSFI